MRRGLIVGTFLVPHRGHFRNISLASAMSDRLDVLVLARKEDPIVADERISWLREHLGQRGKFQIVRRQLPKDLSISPDALAAEVWRHAILDHLSGNPPHAVFGRNPLDAAIAALFNADWIQPDSDLPPIDASGSSLYADPYSNWDAILPAARPLFARRIAVAGGDRAQRNGVALQLAQQLDTAFVPDRGLATDDYNRGPFEQMIARSSRRAYVVAEEGPDEAPIRLADHAVILPGGRAGDVATRYRAAGAAVTSLVAMTGIESLVHELSHRLFPNNTIAYNPV